MTATVKALTIVMHILQKFGKTGGTLYGKNGEKIQEVAFDVEVQYCDPSDCYHDCKHEGVNNCDADMTTIW
ncbi:MAG: hypothetical protein ACLURP_09420 [Ruminococcus sp.]